MQINEKHIPAPKNCKKGDIITCHVLLLDGSDITVGELYLFELYLFEHIIAGKIIYELKNPKFIFQMCQNQKRVNISFTK